MCSAKSHGNVVLGTCKPAGQDALITCLSATKVQLSAVASASAVVITALQIELYCPLLCYHAIPNATPPLFITFVQIRSAFHLLACCCCLGPGTAACGMWL